MGPLCPLFVLAFTSTEQYKETPEYRSRGDSLTYCQLTIPEQTHDGVGGHYCSDRDRASYLEMYLDERSESLVA
ncbi:hypothetical protein DAEQUDRAFT_733245 [Daedalea quercina L-15889]|uniref:Uncharacterized protein n=1 Tax=Daedalea quercina L-15889 TaxID=1314783 RepID=A0A165L5A6_9APHY|nr:hypothetical protein DAEQUDRAFT_733245 [Daedalea quercina L-15889]